VIENLLIQEQVNYEFYHILEDLIIDTESVLDKKFDVFYSINYFGQLNNIKDLNINEKIVIEDNVFFYDFENVNNFKYWFGFNSFRKISSFGDGSLIKTNLEFDSSQIIHNQAEFVQKKYKAKGLKYKYLNHSIGSEKDYIRLFEEGEKLLNSQKNIHNMSSISIFQMMVYDKAIEQNISKEYYDFLFQEFQPYCLNNHVEFYSYFVMKILKRDELRKYLFSKNIFLPIHWPKSSQENPLYEEVISIPLFSNYSMDDMKYIVTNIKEFYEKY
jgi:dTDP-4-amino-4,6-dideoxygalactose transaminase